MTKQWVFLMFLVSSLAAGCNNRPAESPADTNQGTEAGAPAGAPGSPVLPGRVGPPRTSSKAPRTYLLAELASPRAAWPAARRAVGTRNGEQDT